MPYIQKKNGGIELIGFGISKINDLYLDSGEQLEVNVSLVDKRRITDRQRKYIFALLNDFCDWTGDDSEILRLTIMNAYEKAKGIELGSLTMYSETNASELIDSITEWLLSKGFVDVQRAKEYDYKFDERQTYGMALNRICCVCGRHHADIHHVDHVGTRGNRNKISHIGLRALPLCRLHHTQAHNMDKKEFEDLHHLSPFVIDKKMEYFIKRGTLKMHTEDEKELAKENE